MATVPWGNCPNTRYNEGKYKEIARTSLGEGIQRSCTMNENPRNLTRLSQRRHCAYEEIGPTSIRKAYGGLGHTSQKLHNGSKPKKFVPLSTQGRYLKKMNK
jgi:hypothetical protein